MINLTRLLDTHPSVSETACAVCAGHSSPRGKTATPAPVVVINVTRHCNLRCQHCYLAAEKRLFSGELSTTMLEKLLAACAALRTPVVLFSGGEPLARPDIFHLLTYAKTKGLRVALSTNGTLISKRIACRLRQTGIDYIGISIDGREMFHDRFRDCRGAFGAAMNGIMASRDEGIKTGMRFTLSKLNAEELPYVLDLCEREQIPRFCLYHLVYTGRGNLLRKQDVGNRSRRAVMDFLIQRVLALQRKRRSLEILTVDNHADGIYAYLYVQKRNPAQAEKVLKLLRLHAGCSAGEKIIAVSPQGDVNACQFWNGRPLGNIRKKDFLSLWTSKKNTIRAALGNKEAHLEGKCGRCQFNLYCGGCRMRALAVHRNLWYDDPCCYLTEAEIRRRVTARAGAMVIAGQ